MDNIINTRPSLRALGRKAVAKKGWHENCEYSGHAPANYRRDRVRMVRHRENHHLRNHLTNVSFEDFEPLCLAKRDADWLYF